MNISKTEPTVVSRAEWLAARKQLLAKEKEFIRQRDALSAARRQLPMVEVTEHYEFEQPDGKVTFLNLFAGRKQLIVYHFMFDPDWNEGCPSCSLWCDSIGANPIHLAARDTSFVVVSRAPIAKIEAFKKRMGWSFDWVSSLGTSFNTDYQVTIDEAAGFNRYNYEMSEQLRQRGAIWIDKGELPGLSVFFRDGDRVFHSYSAYARGLDPFMNVYNFLDVTPLGRDEDDLPWTMAWVRHHDKYAPA